MPCLNAGAYLRDAAASVLEQALPPPWRVELLLVDDASSDPETLAQIQRLSSHPAVRVFVNTRSQGVSRARNQAIAAAWGSLIAFLDADDLWAPHHLATHIAALHTHQADFSASDYAHIDADGRTLQSACLWSHRRKGPLLQARLGEQPSAAFERPAELFIRACPAWICAVVVRREALGAAPVFNESLALAEDLELWIRLARQHDFVFCRDSTASYRKVGGSLTNAAGPCRLDAVTGSMYEALAARPEFAPHRAAVREAAGTHYLSAAYGYKQLGQKRRALMCLARAWRCLPLDVRPYRQLLALPWPVRDGG